MFFNPYAQMNPIQALQKRGGKGLIYYLLANYPSFDRCLQLVEELVTAGMTALGLGVPFAKPFLDSEVIQRAHHHVLREGYQSTDLLVILHHIKKRHPDLPVFLVGYEESFSNQMFHLNAFLYDGIICPDGKVHVLGVPQIPLVSKEEDMRHSTRTEWFIYLSAQQKEESEKSTVPLLRLKENEAPVYVSSSIYDAEELEQVLSEGADGIVVYTELIKRATEEPRSLLRWLKRNEQMMLQFA